MNTTDAAWAGLVSAHHATNAARNRLRYLEAKHYPPRCLLTAKDRRALDVAESNLLQSRNAIMSATAAVLACQPGTALDFARQTYAGNPATQAPDAVCDCLGGAKPKGPMTFGYLRNGPDTERHTRHMLEFGIPISAIYTEAKVSTAEFRSAVRALRHGDTLVICDPKSIGSKSSTRLDSIAKVHANDASVVIWKPEGQRPIETIAPAGQMV
jgi:hypothetical protein